MNKTIRHFLTVIAMVLFSVMCFGFAACEKSERLLESIEITTPPTKVTYEEGEYFDPTGMVITAYYDDDSSEVVTDYTLGKTTALTASDTFVNVIYNKKTAKQSITVNPKPTTDDAELLLAVTDEVYGLELRFYSNGVVYGILEARDIKSAQSTWTYEGGILVIADTESYEVTAVDGGFKVTIRIGANSTEVKLTAEDLKKLDNTAQPVLTVVGDPLAVDLMFFEDGSLIGSMRGNTVAESKWIYSEDTGLTIEDDNIFSIAKSGNGFEITATVNAMSTTFAISAEELLPLRTPILSLSENTRGAIINFYSDKTFSVSAQGMVFYPNAWTYDNGQLNMTVGVPGLISGYDTTNGEDGGITIAVSTSAGISLNFTATAEDVQALKIVLAVKESTYGATINFYSDGTFGVVAMGMSIYPNTWSYSNGLLSMTAGVSGIITGYDTVSEADGSVTITVSTANGVSPSFTLSQADVAKLSEK